MKLEERTFGTPCIYFDHDFWLPGIGEYSEALKTAHETATSPACFANLYLDENVNSSPFDGNCNQVAHGYCSR